MGRLINKNKYNKDLRIILNHRMGSLYSMIWMFIAGPFIIPLYDTLGNGIVSGLRIIATLEEFLVIEAIALLIFILRLLRDYLLKRKIYPRENEKKLVDIAIKKLKQLKKKQKRKNNEYVDAINRLIDRNIEIQNKENL